ncbi:CHAT domain-containing protein [Scytonema millei]|uniref:CHAT domain-containing protein n=1 Tax=Scytonema millei VB511283 TaxID=1245923 RepID=A0A9X5I520_9CYAN|nr:CHAT domain-containing protein [Scytonema millei]NHC35550.1 CHAT domain-containing protein [Scytonema millei VB511283]
MHSISKTYLAVLLIFLPGTAIAAPSAPEIASQPTRSSGDDAQLLQQGRELYTTGQFAQAIKIWQQAAQNYKAKGDKLNLAIASSNLSLAYQQLGQWQQAEQAIAVSFDVLQGSREQGSNSKFKIQNSKFPDSRLPTPDSRGLPVLAQALNTQASLQLGMGQAETAVSTWQQAATAYERAGDRSGNIQSLLNQSQALQALGLYRRALETLTSADRSLSATPDSPLKAAGLRQMGNLLRSIGDLPQSQQILQRSLELARKLNSQSDIAASLFSLGNTARSQRDNPTALAYYQQAATTAIAPITKLQARLNQFSLLVDTQDSTAQSLIPEIQSLLATIPPSSKTIYAQIDFAQSLMIQGSTEQGAGSREKRAEGAEGEKTTLNRQPSSQSVAPAFTVNRQPSTTNYQLPITQIAQLLASAVDRSRNLGDRRAEAYAIGSLGSLYEQNRQWQDAQELTQQALILSQAANAPDITYRWQWQLARLLRMQGDTPGAIATYREAVKTLKSLRNDLVAVNPEIQFNFRDEVEPVYRELVALLLSGQKSGETPQQNLAQARETIEALQLAELDNFFREACIEAQPVAIDRVVDRDNPTAAVIYPIILPDRLEVILKIPQQPLRHYTIHQPQTQVEQTVERLQRSLTEPDRTKDVRDLSQQIYNWLIQPVANELQQSGVKTLVFVPDGVLRNIPMSALFDGKQYLVEKYAIAVSPGLQLTNPQPISLANLKALTAGLSVPPANSPFPPLPAVRLEFNLIQQAGVAIAELLDRAFTSKSLETKIDSNSFNVVHLATHGQFSSQAENTFILAADGPINVRKFDDLLRSRNRRRPNAIELLVLSACETATGDRRAALGLAGIAVRAGARSTLASLWQIDDEATAIFIGEFYKQLTKTKLTRAEALRQAQLNLMKNYPNYRRPGYWAAYVLVGNWL